MTLDQVFEELGQPMVDGLFEGFNGTICEPHAPSRTRPSRTRPSHMREAARTEPHAPSRTHRAARTEPH